MKKTTIYIPALLLLFAAPLVMGQDWPVPTEEAEKANPLPYTLENVKSGKAIYTLNCKSCHGDPGKNNPLALVPLPVDIASERMQANTEGELFYKISNGKGVMPPFQSTLSEADRWMLVNLIENYSPDREALFIDAPPIKARLLASVSQEKGSIEILAEYEGTDAKYLSLVGAPVSISSRRAFGNIWIGQAVTNDMGRAEFIIPEEVKGDEEGYISMVVSLDENFEAQEVALEKAFIGKPKDVPQLIQPEVLWSTNDNVSTWLLLSYILAAGGSWFVIGYVVFQIIKIKRYSKSS
jgi:mono/diheme cytochrome c family protein